MYIYCITNIISNKQYVGLTTRAIDESKNYYGSGVYIMRAIKKHGKHNFKKEKDIADTILYIRKQLKVNKGEYFPIYNKGKSFYWLEK